MTGGQPMITCPVCGTLNTPDRVFCRKCASDLHATVVLPGQAPPPPPKAEIPIKPIIIGGGLALLLILAAIAAVLTFGALSPASSTSSPTPSVESTAPIPPSAGPTLSPTSVVTPAPVTAPPATPATPPTPGPTPTDAPPIIRFFTGPADVDCSDPAFLGTIHLSWRIGNADGASLSIDFPGVYKSYTGVLGQDDVPFACDGNSHTYILVTFGGLDPPAEKDLVIAPKATP